MGFTVVPDRSAGDVFTESMWDTYIKDNFNTGIPVLLASSTLAIDTASIDFTSIPQDWAHLMLVAYVRETGATAVDGLTLRFNADSGANYDYQNIHGSASSATANEAFGQTFISAADIPGASAGANLFAAVVIEIPYYAQTSNNKTATCSSAHKSGTSSGNLRFNNKAGFWRSNAAISQVTIAGVTGNLLAGSRASLYGMP